MIPDPTDEIRAIRNHLAAEYDFDLDRIIEETRNLQRKSGREIVTLPSRPPQRQSAKNDTARADEGGLNVGQ
jgi:hypothetical protein